jgi:flavodoxin
MKPLVVYYSKTGNNKYLAEKIAHTLMCDIQEIAPRLNVIPLQILFSLIKTSTGIKALVQDVDEYDRIIVCGPIWMGQLISPLRDFIKKYSGSINKLYFATCCGGGDAEKDGKFGYTRVFQQIIELAGDRCIHCEAFSIQLTAPDDQKEDSAAIMKIRLSDDNFKGEIQKKFDAFIQKTREE